LPDWVTHLGTTYLASHAAVRIDPNLAPRLSVRHLLLGALLPDVSRFTIILVDILDWPAIPIFTYFIPWHSLLIVSLFAGALALVLPLAGLRVGPAFGLIMLGALFHFVLDEFDGLVGCGSTFLYPFYFNRLFRGWEAGGHWATLLLVGSAMAVGLAWSHRRVWPRLIFCFTRRRLAGAAGLTLLALLIPLFFQGWMIEQNAYYLGFAVNPAAFEGQTVELCFSEVIATRPPTVEEFDRPFRLDDQTTGLNRGEWLSLRGVVQNGAIRPTKLIIHRDFSDLIVSLAAAVAFIFLMIDLETLRDLGRALT